MRTPLRALHGYGSLLDEEYKDKLGESGRNAIAKILAKAQEMATMLEAFIGMIRTTQVKFDIEDVDLSDKVKSILTSLQKSAPQRRVATRIDSGLRTRGDTEQLNVLLRILLDNAWKFTSNEEEGKIEFTAQEEDGTLTYTIQDNGVGFDMAYADKLFLPFQRLHPFNEFSGHSIGLAVAHRIVTRHGGQLWGKGAVGEGAAFRFTLNVRSS